MPRFLRPFLLILVIACKSTLPANTGVTVPPHSQLVVIKLTDSLGLVSFAIPDRYDTAFNWTHYTDCVPGCDYAKYRFQPASLPVYKENGFYSHMPDIPVDQFTIVHPGYLDHIRYYYPSPDTTKNRVRRNFLKSNLWDGEAGYQLKLDTIEKINDRYFAIAGAAGFDTTTQKHFATLGGLTIIRNIEIEFYYKVRSKAPIDEKAFFHRSIAQLRTLRFSRSI